MTKTILLAALAALLAAPAFANTMRTTPKPQQGQIGDLQHSPKVLWDVFVNGKYVGSDPDAAIRSQLIRHFGAE
jgi:hypothetical protein